MNEGHLRFLASGEWADMLRTDLLPWLDSVAALGDDVLEVGPGPGLTTDILRERTSRLTAVEVDDELAAALKSRLAGTNVEVVHGDAGRTDFSSDRFSSATCFSVLHHIPSAEQQDAVFAEINRVLRPGAALLGTDSLDTETIRQAHLDDTFVPVDPATFGTRLEAAGFADVSISVLNDYHLRFHATKPR
jgi:SAM-dependent methyltransferase